MKEVKNGKLRSGRKVYRVIAEQKRENYKPETCRLTYQSGRHAFENRTGETPPQPEFEGVYEKEEVKT